jgi:hypothetical protein
MVMTQRRIVFLARVAIVVSAAVIGASLVLMVIDIIEQITR